MSTTLDQFGDAIWYFALFLSLLIGIFILIRTRGFTMSLVKPSSIKYLKNDGTDKDKVSSLEAFFIGMGNHMGIGNISGIASAIMTGGPGAIFWIWVFSFINSAVAFMEATLAQIYKARDAEGKFFGSPAYYILRGMRSRKFAAVMAVAGILLYLSNISIQTSNSISAITTALDIKSSALIIVIIFAVLVFLGVMKGAKGVAVISSKVVPIMALAWVIMALITIACNWQNIPNIFQMIFVYAFNPPSVIGGFIGTTIMIAMRRATYTNDAGTGSMARISALADVKHPVKQGIVQSMGVYADTLLLCSITAFAILSFGDYESICGLGLNYVPLVQEIMSRTVIGDAAPYLIAVIVFVFAYTTVITCFTMGLMDVKFLKDNKISAMLWTAVSFAIVIIGGLTSNATAETVVDIFTALIIILNLYAIYSLRGRAFEALRNYRKQRSEGKDEPVFSKDDVSDNNGITEW